MHRPRSSAPVSCWPACCCARAAHNPYPHQFRFESGRRPGPGGKHSGNDRAVRDARGRQRTEATMAAEKLIIFDTTMRDGEQSPGAAMTRDEKLRIARALERMHVDVIEAGFPASSDGDFAAVQAVARAIRDSTICGLARANELDVRRCGEAVRVAKSP